MSEKRILIVGSGFAGMWAALAAARLLDCTRKPACSIEIAVVSPEPQLHMRPRLYENDVSNLSAPLADLFQVAGVRYIQGSVQQIDTIANQVSILSAGARTTHLRFDRLVLASGSNVVDPGVPGLAQHGFNVDQLAGAQRLQSHLQSLTEEPDTLSRNSFVIAGAGFTGIETAAEFPARARLALGVRTPIRVIVLEAAASIGPDLGDDARPIIEAALRDLGVQLRLNTLLKSVEADSILTSRGERIATNTLIWTAGVRANPLTLQIPSARDRLGRLHVDSELRAIASECIFAAGDVAFAKTDELGNHAMMSCQHAMQLGRTAGNNAAADLLGLPTSSYSQPEYVTCVDLGSCGAVFTRGWERTVIKSGLEAKAIKKHINTQRIYPPRADRAAALAAADPRRRS